MEEISKLDELVKIINEYTEYLTEYSGTQVETIIKDEVLRTKKYKVKTAYGIEERGESNYVKIPKGVFIKITYNKPKLNVYEFKSIEFPIEDLDKRLVHYKNKVENIKKSLIKEESAAV